eukprot:5502945-Amphidinium_carterae.1
MPQKASTEIAAALVGGCFPSLLRSTEQVWLAMLVRQIKEGICPLTDDVDDFLHKLREMEPKTGETKLTPALRKAWLAPRRNEG